jgi:hypothetical protein
MSFAGISYIAVFFAAVAGFAFGAVYYTLLGTQWMTALGKTREDIERQRSPLPFVIAAAAQLVMAFVLAGTIGHLGQGMVTIRNGVISALFVWVGFVATTMAVNYAFQGARYKLTLIDGGHWLGGLLIQGLIIGWIGV